MYQLLQIYDFMKLNIYFIIIFISYLNTHIKTIMNSATSALNDAHNVHDENKSEVKSSENNFLKDKKSTISLYGGKGFVKLVDCMPSSTFSTGHKTRTTADFAIAQAARISYGHLDGKSEKEDQALIEYLMENWHTSCFEMISFKFVIQAPIYVVRQLDRHRTSKQNQMSLRYTKALDEFHYPDIRYDDKFNKQGSVKPDDSKMSDEEKEKKKMLENRYLEAQKKVDDIFADYNFLVNNGVAKEVARSILPVAEFTKLYWKMDLHNLFHFLRLRMDHHAQLEIRELAFAIFELIKPIVPISCNAFEKFRINAVSFSSDEKKLLPFVWNVAADGKTGLESEFEIKSLCEAQKIKLSARQLDAFVKKLQFCL